MNNCRTPLQLKWDTDTNQYKVNKPEDQSGLYVSKKVADDLLTALADLRARCMNDDPEFNVPSIDVAIDNAIGEEPEDLFSRFAGTVLFPDFPKKEESQDCDTCETTGLLCPIKDDQNPSFPCPHWKPIN